jgi:hypothetical protein
MSNRIIDVRVDPRSPDPASAELWVSVRPERRTSTTEVRGRLVGPSCAFADTVEVAYPLRPLRSEQQSPDVLRHRVVIPEASLWDTQSPFLYAGPVELWEEGRRADVVQVCHGLRLLGLGPRGLRVNGRPLTLRGRALDDCDASLPARLRRQGVNLMVLPVREELLWCWYAAAVNGLFVLGRLASEEDAVDARLSALAAMPSCLGWLVPPDRSALAAGLRGPGGPFVGIEGDPREGTDFVVRDSVLTAAGVDIGAIESGAA